MTSIAKLAAVAGFALALAGSRMPWVEGVDNVWGAFGSRRHWLEEFWLDVRYADGWAVVFLASIGGGFAAASFVRRLDYWIVSLFAAVFLFSLALREMAYIRDRGEEARAGLEFVAVGAGLALAAILLHAAIRIATGPPYFGERPRR